MASVGTESNVFDDFEEEHLTCQICLERFKDARVLPCQHYYCRECLTRFSKGEKTLKCPACRFECRLPGGGVLGLPKCLSVNAFVTFLEERSTTGQDGGLVCDGCEEKIAAIRCIVCAANLCDGCGKCHAKMKATRGHKQKTLAEYESTKFKGQEADQVVPLCTIHADGQKIYCCDCQVIVCLECSVFDHAQHNHVCLEAAVQDAKSRIQSCLTELKTKHDQAVESRNNIKSKMDILQETLYNESKKIENCSKIILQKVTEKFEAIKRQINTDKTNKLEYLQTQYAQIIPNMSSQLECTERDINQVSSVMSSLEDIMQQSPTIIIARQRSVISEVENVKYSNVDALSNLGFPKFQKEKYFETALENVKVKHLSIGRFQSSRLQLRTQSDVSLTAADDKGRYESRRKRSASNSRGNVDDSHTSETDDTIDSPNQCQQAYVDIHTQKETMRDLLKTPLKRGDTWYLVGSRWFKQWKKYVGYDSWDLNETGKQISHPGPIDNFGLFKENSHNLKEHLEDGSDYSLVPEVGWKKLSSWYGKVSGQRPIARKVIEYGMFVKHCKVEVYLMEFKLCKYPILHVSVMGKFSRESTITEIEEKMRRVFNVSEDKETRVWNKYLSNTYEHLSKKNNTVQDVNLYQGQVLVLEEKNADGTWPRHSELSTT
ncbi:probable E3 ubiquitin-protein ligase MID2 [Ptychodera flava]|uniref:probable E3 ubiquitin-protein ligase MID2 n=1 Tax=Ptychodera flava TaxID=63121 RepID=UPI00396A52A8